MDEFDSSDFTPEFSGRKRGKICSNLDYLTYHGDVVLALYADRRKNQKHNEKIFNKKLIDLCVKCDGKIIEVYEVKTTCNRQSLYTAIGQLIVHSGWGDKVKRTIVLPIDDQIPKDIEAVLHSVAIEIRHFSLEGKKIHLH